jgi:hypothetical protein
MLVREILQLLTIDLGIRLDTGKYVVPVPAKANVVTILWLLGNEQDILKSSYVTAVDSNAKTHSKCLSTT